MTHTISFRGSLSSFESWGLSRDALATIVQPASGIVLAKELPIGDRGHFSAALDARMVGQLIATLARLGRSSAGVPLEVHVQGSEGTIRRGNSTWTPSADAAVATFRLAGRTEHDYEVYGVIDGEGVRAGAIVQVLVPESPSFVSVGRGVLQQNGRYRVEYRTSGTPSGSDSPILLRIHQDQRVVHESGALCSVPAALEYNATVGKPSTRPSLFATVSRARLPVGGATLSEAELATIACTLDTEPDNVRRYYLAREQVRTRFDQVPAEVVFGVASAAEVTDEAEFLALDPRTLEAHWSRAVALGVAAEQPDDALGELANRIVDAHLATDTLTPLGEMVQALGLTSVTEREFLGQLLYDFPGTRRDYLAQFQRDAPTAEAEVVRFAFDLSSLLGDHGMVVQLLRDRGAGASTPEDIAGFRQADWEAQLRSLGRDEATVGAVAEAYAATLEQAYPTHATVYRLEAGLFPAASAYLRANPTLDIIQDRIQEFVSRDTTTEADADAVDQLRTVQRLRRIVPSVGAADAVQEVAAASYTSALAIAKTPWDRFRAGFDASAPDERYRSIYKGARRVAMWTLHAAVTVQQSRSSSNFGILLGDEEGDAVDLRTLFDSLDSCVCEPCRSVLSPAAYLVALLEFVQDHISPAAYAELLSRRPWIAETLLDCDNALTPMSKVDLINELLEAEINPPAASASAPQTTWTAERLEAEPEHLDRDAYALLAAPSPYPWELPFDLNTAEIETLLEPARVAWGEVLGTFATTGSAAVRGAWLGLSSGALALVEAGGGDQRAPRWNGAFPMASTAGGVQAFLRTTRTDLEHFEQLARTWFVGRFGLAMDWAPDADPCHLEDAQLRDGPTFEACMVAAERFERMRQATGWSVHELDEALQAFARASSDGSIPAQTTEALADLQRLRRRFEGLDLADLVAWFRVPTHARQPGGDIAFERLFGPPSRFAVLGGLATEWLEVVAGAIGTEVGVVAQLFGDGGEVDSGALPLSRFWGLQGLAKVLGVSLAELAAFVRLSGVHPFGTGPAEVSETNIVQAPSGVLAFLDLWDQWRSLNVSAEEVTSVLEVGSDEAEAEAVEFFAALADARVQVSSSIEPSEEASTAQRLERLLPRVLADEEAEELLAALLGPDGGAALTLSYPQWVDVAAINAALEEPVDADALASLSAEVAVRAANELGTSERAVAYAKLVQQLVDGSFAFEGEVGSPSPTADDRALLGRARLLRALAPLQLEGAGLRRVLGEPPGWLTAAMLDGSVSTELPVAFAAWMEVAAFVTFDRQRGRALGPLLDAQLLEPGTDDAWSSRIGGLVSMSGPDVTIALSGPPSRPPTAAELRRLQRVQGLSERVGATVSRMQQWASDSSGATPSDATVQSVKEAVRSRFEPAVWFATSAASRDRLRVRQRDALIAYLTTRGSARQPGRNVSSPQRLSDTLLIDVQSDACHTTSRIVEATLAVQLFVFRIQLRLEDAVEALPDAAARHWTWMKNYRVWEASKKIFLFPENYLESEFRAGKTPLFDDFVSTMSSSTIDAELAERAFTTYAEGLHAVSFLRPAGIVYDYEHEDPAKKVLHVVAHDRSNPPKYYHREQVLGRWSPWEEVPGSMPNTGVLPVVRRGRLSLYWPSVEPRELPGQVLSEDERPLESARISLAWVERTGEGWQAERRSAVGLVADFHVRDAGKPQYFARPHVYGLHQSADEDGVLGLTARGRNRHSVHVLGSFRPGACGGQWRVEQSEEYTQTRVPGYTNRTGQRLEFWSETDVGAEQFVAAGLDLGNGVRLVRTPRPYEYIFQRKGMDMMRRLPFVFTDDDRTFLVRSGYRRPEPEPAPGSSGGFTTEVTGTLALQASFSTVEGAQHSATSGDGQWTTAWSFEPLSHELVCDVVQALRERGVDGVFEPELPSILGRQVGYLGSVLEDWYQPTNDVQGPFPKLGFDFEPGSAYSTYNWELFFHNPAHTALQLAAQGQFEQAQQWWHYIFNPQKPFGNTTSGPRRFWRVKPLAEAPRSIEDILRNLAAGDEGDDALREQTIAALDEWIDHPFDAHAVAARRPGSYQRWVVARYLDLLIAWGDSLYRQHTRESINEAAQLYMVAAQLLGPRPERLPGQEVQARSYAQLRQELDESGNALVELENVAPLPVVANAVSLQAALPQMATVYPGALQLGADPLAALTGVEFATAPATANDADDTGTTSFAGPARPDAFRQGEAELEVPRLHSMVDDLPLGIWANPAEPREGLYFCVPSNPVFDHYWDAVGQRLFNIRNCRDIDGNVRELALFAPPVDPKLLARATASGLDVGAAISELSAPVPLYRFRVALALAKEVAAEVKALGSALQSALQSADGEELAQLRAQQEVRNLDEIRSIRERRIEEAEASIESLQVAKVRADERASHYRDLFADDVPTKAELKIGEERQLNTEKQQIEGLNESSSHATKAGSNALAAGFVGLIPSFSAGWSLGAHFTASFGGGNIAAPLSGLAALHGHDAASDQASSSRAGIYAAKTRREQDWYLQLRQAEREVDQVERDLVAAEIRLQQAQQELDNHDFSREQSEAVEAYLTRRFTNAELHRWMANELSATYSKAYGFALDLARRAERCFQFELGQPGVTFVRSAQFVGRRKGLLAGNELVADLQRLEAEYQMANTREYELVKRVSLAELDPWSLLQLRESGQCEIAVDESLLDLDHPGHYFRRIKMVRVSLPAVSGPYVSTAGRLTLLSSEIRTEGTVGSELFSAQPGGPTSIALSTGQDDSGMLEPSLRDDRYLPFEGKGAISRWSLQLPRARSFDYQTISDVVLEISYTAREGDPAFRQAVEETIAAELAAREHVGAPGAVNSVGPTRAWSLAAAFPEVLQALRRDGEATIVLPSSAVPMGVTGEGPADVVASTVVLAGAPEGAAVSLSEPGDVAMTPTAVFRLPDDTETNLRFAATGSGAWVDQPLTVRVVVDDQPTTLDDVVLLLTFGV